MLYNKIYVWTILAINRWLIGDAATNLAHVRLAAARSDQRPEQLRSERTKQYVKVHNWAYPTSTPATVQQGRTREYLQCRPQPKRKTKPLTLMQRL